MRTRIPARPLGLAALTLIAGGAASAAFAAPSETPAPATAPPPHRDRPTRPVPGLHNAGAGERAAVAPVRTRRPAAVFPIAARSVDYGTATNRFGAQRSSHAHAGQDVFAPAGAPLRAVRDAVVVEAGSDGARGNHVALYSPAAGLTFAYFHLEAPSPLRVGWRVRAGQRVGAVGCTGSCQGDHLHFEVRRGRGGRGALVDPLPLLRRWQRGPAA